MKYIINAIILASGFSKRMGSDKLILPVKNKSLIEVTVDEILKMQFNEVILVYRTEEVKEVIADRNIVLLRNIEAERGMSESIKIGIRNSSNCDGYMFFVGDQINLQQELMLKLITAFEYNSSSIIVPLYKGNRGNPVIFPAEFKNELLELSGDKGGRVIIDKYKERVIFVNVEDDELGMDIDTEEDYSNYLKMKR